MLVKSFCEISVKKNCCDKFADTDGKESSGVNLEDNSFTDQTKYSLKELAILS